MADVKVRKIGKVGGGKKAKDREAGATEENKRSLTRRIRAD